MATSNTTRLEENVNQEIERYVNLNIDLSKYYSLGSKFSNVITICNGVCSESKKDDLLSYFKQTSEVLNLFKEHELADGIMEFSYLTLLGYFSAETEFDDWFNTINQTNSFIIENKDNLSLYLDPFINSVSIDSKFKHPEKSFSNLVLNIFNEYKGADHEREIASEVLSSLKNSIPKFYESVYDNINLLLSPKLGCINKNEFIFYQDAIGEKISNDFIESMICSSRNYKNIDVLEFEPFRNYYLNLTNYITSDLKYSLNMKDIKLLVKTYKLVFNTLGESPSSFDFDSLFPEPSSYRNVPNIARESLFNHFNESMDMGETEVERRSNLKTFCYETQRLIKEDPELFRTQFMQTYCEVGA